MKKILTVTGIICAILFSCKQKEVNKEANTKTEKLTFMSFGNKIAKDGAISSEEMYKKYENLLVGDTIDVKFSTKINEVCKKKGCWVKVPLANNKESFVKFKDYAFFLPMDADGSTVVLNGKAFKAETSIEELQHYAKDAGKSAEDIAKITEPKTTYSFIADGVLLANSVAK